MSTIFGPVPSRRLGLSLGVDLVPAKTCNFDCLYCECGRTTEHTTERRPYVPAETVLSELEAVLKVQDDRLDYITLSGAGEPTLNSDMGRIIQGIRSLSDAPVALLTNSSLLSRSEVMAEIADLDLIMPSLDSAVPRTFRRIDRPVNTIKLEDILAGLGNLRSATRAQIWLEILFLAGINDTEAELEALVKAVDLIDPHRVQLNTVDRPPPDGRARALSRAELDSLKRYFGPRAEVIARGRVQFRPVDEEDLYQTILELIDRRPCTQDDLVAALGVTDETVAPLLKVLQVKGRVVTERQTGEVFYRGIPTEA